MTESNTIMKVFEAISDVYPYEGSWALDCRIMRTGADDFETHRFTFKSQENADHFQAVLSDLEGQINNHMQELAEEIYFLQSMLSDGEPYILLESAEDADEDDEAPVPRLLN